MSARNLRECLLDSADDLENSLKQMMEFLLEGNKKRTGDESLSSLTTLFEGKLGEIKGYLGKVDEYQQREELIRELEECVANRDEIIQRVETDLKAAESVITATVFQANKKLKGMLAAEARPLNTEQVVHLAHQISRTYSVAAPLFWQQGDPSRPFPTEPELRNSHLSAPARPLPSVMGMARPQAPTVGVGMTGRTPTQQPGRIGVSPMGAAYAQTHMRSWSPRTGYGQPSTSPRGGRAGVTPNAGMPRPPGTSPYGSARRISASGGTSGATVQVQFTSPTTRPIAPSVPKVEQMSSDSSSSSSSDDEGPTPAQARANAKKDGGM